MLEAKGLTKFYGSHKALDALDLSVEAGLPEEAVGRRVSG